MTVASTALPIRRALIGAALILAVAGNVVGLATIVIDHRRAFDWEIYLEAARRYAAILRVDREQFPPLRS